MNYQVGDYVYHPKLGVGRIREIVETENADCIIDFENSPHLRMAQTLLRMSTLAVSPGGFRALVFDNREEAMKLITQNPVQVFTLVLKDLRGRAKTEDIRDYLAPYLANKEWPKWWKGTQPLLKRSAYIDTSKADEREYRLRTEAISLAEESFERFQRLSSRISPEELYPEAIRVFNAFNEGAALTVEHRETLKNYFVLATGDSRLQLGTRLDAVFRLAEVNWILPEMREKAIGALAQSGLKIYQLNTFAQNRLVEFLIEKPGDETICRVLLAGLCADPDVLEEVAYWILHSGNSTLVEQGLQVLLSENLPPELPVDHYSELDIRLQKGIRLLESLVATPESFRIVIESFSQFLKILSKAPANGLDGKLRFASIASFASALYLRSQAFDSNLGEDVIKAFTASEFPPAFLHGLIIGTESIHVANEFRSSVENRLFETRIPAKDHILQQLISKDFDNPVTRTAELVEIAQQYSTNVELLDSIANRIGDIVREAKTSELPKMLSYMDRLADLGSGREWRDTIDAFRERGYEEALRRIRTNEGDNQEGAGRLDPAILHAVQKRIQLEMEDAQHEINQLRQELATGQKLTTHLEARLAEREDRLRELSGGFNRTADEIKEAERRRIMLALATSVAEFERFAAKQGRVSPELDAILRRLSSLMAANGVTPKEPIGTELPFDPTSSQLIEDDNASSPTLVQVVERGYVITDIHGEKKLLKRSLVKRKSVST